MSFPIYATADLINFTLCLIMKTNTNVTSTAELHCMFVCVWPAVIFFWKKITAFVLNIITLKYLCIEPNLSYLGWICHRIHLSGRDLVNFIPLIYCPKWPRKETIIQASLLQDQRATWNSTKVNVVSGFKEKVEFWSCDCIVKETVWNRSEKVDHLAYWSIGVYCKILESTKW